jgi:ATP-binding cassette, subfamily A (ABC1), member 3
VLLLTHDDRELTPINDVAIDPTAHSTPPPPPPPPWQVDFVPFPITGYTTNGFYGLAAQLFALFFTIALMYPVSRLIRGLVMEKEMKIREGEGRGGGLWGDRGAWPPCPVAPAHTLWPSHLHCPSPPPSRARHAGMRMMGLTDSALFGSWLVTYALIFLFIAAAITIITRNNMFKASNGFLVFLFFWIYGLSSVTYCYLVRAAYPSARPTHPPTHSHSRRRAQVSVFFSRAKTASSLGVVLYLGSFFPWYAVNAPSECMARRVGRGRHPW